MLRLVLMTDITDSEFAFLAARIAACVARRGNTHVASHCGCHRRPTWCSRCQRDDFEFPETTLSYVGDGHWFCADCVDATADDQTAIAAE